jgi:putative ABC transport system substrate-binding protein
MRRREFITLIGGAAAAWPVGARAQQSERARRIGSLTSLAESDADAKAWDAAFRMRLQELGWVIGRNLQIDYRWAAGNADRIRTYAAELVAMKPDALIAVTSPVVAALQRETRTVPIVFSGVSDPVGSGFIKSLAHPESNATGWSNYTPTLSGKWVEVLKEIAPSISRIGVLFNPITAPYVTGYYMPDMRVAAATLSVEPIITVVHEVADFETSILEFARKPGGALIVMPDAFTFLHRTLIVASADKHRVPAIYPYRYVCREGGLMAYAPDLGEPFPLMAEYIDRILKGEKPGDLPVQAPTRFEMAINLKTAKVLGLTVPPTLLTRADEVIE